MHFLFKKTQVEIFGDVTLEKPSLPPKSCKLLSTNGKRFDVTLEKDAGNFDNACVMAKKRPIGQPGVSLETCKKGHRTEHTPENIDK